MANYISHTFRDVEMTIRMLAFLGMLLVCACLTGQALGASTSAVEIKQARVQFQQAEDLAAQRQIDISSSQKTLDSLLDQKALWQLEIVNAKGKIAIAKDKLIQATTIGNQDEIKKYEDQRKNWETRLKAAVVEMENIESSISEAINNLRSTTRITPEKNLILPGEAIEVFVTEDETLNGVYSIRQGGYIIMPRVGRISLAGLDMSGAERAIKQALQVNQLKEATVMVERPQGGGVGVEPVIYLAGEFLHPGAWKIPHDLSPTVVTTILRSGGLTPAADLTKVRLLRLVSGQSLAEEVNVQSILNGSGLPSDVTLQSGDIVMVPAYANVIYVTGNVMKPGALKLLPDDEPTVYSAILRAGGFSRFANKKKVYVLRDLGNGDKQKVPVDIRSLQDGGGGDLVLKSKDIVVVPEKFFSF